jgi:radical SAM superfamily enzyme YgiQ (UPF0313 family)
MAKVILISPPYVDLYGPISRAAGRYFPLGLGYIASSLRRGGRHQVLMYEPEAQKLTYGDLTRIIKEADPDVIGLTCATPNFFRALELAKICREQTRAKIVLGGVHASALPEFIVEHHGDLIDCVVVGEGEQTMLELVQAYEYNSPLEVLAGVVFRKDGEVLRTAPRGFIEDLDSLSPPARDLIPQRLFWPNLHNARYRHCVSILTSRGCPFNCTFCASRIVSGKRYRAHSAEYVLEEMEMVKKDHGARQLLITDDTFTIDRERLEAICQGMIDRRLNLSWLCFSQVTSVDRQVLKVMKRAGCYSIGFGVESSDEGILRRMGKSIKPRKALETIRIANEVGLKTQAFFIFGSPGETRAQMEETIAFAKKVNATLAFFNMLVPYPGTKEFEHYFSSVLLSEIDWKNFVAVGERCVIGSSVVPPREIERLLAEANKEYYRDPRRLLNLLFHIRTPYELSNYARGGIGLFKQISRWG